MERVEFDLISCFFQLAGIKEGDFIVEIAGIDVKWYTHQEIVSLIQTTGSSCLEMKIITPMDRNYLKVELKSKSLQNSLFINDIVFSLSFSPSLVLE